MITHAGGRICPCGQSGCFERYASVSALCAATADAAAAHPDSVLAKKAAEGINGKTAFAAAREGCPVAAAVIDGWLTELAAGLRALRMVFAPDMLVLAGGIVNEGKALLDLTLPELQAFHPAFEQDVFDDLSMLACVEKRRIPGAPAPDMVQRAIDQAREQLKA